MREGVVTDDQTLGIGVGVAEPVPDRVVVCSRPCRPRPHTSRSRSTRTPQYLRPLYRALYADAESRQAALDTFAANREMYHPIAAKMVAADLHIPAA